MQPHLLKNNPLSFFVKRLSKMKKTSSKVNWLRRILITAAILLLLAVILIPAANYYVVKQSKESLYNSVDSIPYNKVGLVLGTVNM